jgi:hypothetical protein
MRWTAQSSCGRRFVTVKFVSYGCTAAGCSGRLQVDGKGIGVLRYTAGDSRRQPPTSGVAFGHCLLYAWLDRMLLGDVAWWQFWRETLIGYKRCPFVPPALYLIVCACTKLRG